MRYLVSVILVWLLGLGGVSLGQDAVNVCGDMPQSSTLTKKDTASIEGAIAAIAMLRQCQIVNRPGKPDEHIREERQCIRKTLGSGAYSAIAHVDLSSNPFYSNVGVRELMKCVNTTTDSDNVAAAKPADDATAKLADAATKLADAAVKLAAAGAKPGGEAAKPVEEAAKPADDAEQPADAGPGSVGKAVKPDRAANDGEGKPQVTLDAIQEHLARFLSMRQAPTDASHAYPLPDVRTTRYRIIGGISVAAAASQTPEAKFLGDAAVQFPLSKYQDLGAVWALWGDLRIASIAQPGPISNIASSGVSSYVTPASAAPNDIVQSFELHAGLDAKLHTFGKNQTPNTLSAVVAGGIITPISTSQWTPVFYQVSADVLNGLEKEYPASSAKFTSACVPDSTGKPTTTCYVAFPPVDRTTLYHDWGAGARMKWYWYDKTANTYTFPANVDLLFGQSEYVTGGKLSGWVLHFGGTTPIPAYPWLYVTGSFDTRLGNPSQGNSYTLVTAPSGTTLTLTDPNVVAVGVTQPNRDRWQFGIGFDIPTIVNHWSKKQ